jgi:hypothetical protein
MELTTAERQNKLIEARKRLAEAVTETELRERADVVEGWTMNLEIRGEEVPPE